MKPPLISFFLLSRVIFHFIYLISKTWYRKMRFLRLFYRHFDAKNILNGAYFLGITSRWPLFMCKQSDYSLNSLQYYVRISFANDYLYSIFMLQAVQVNSMPLILSCPISVLFSRGSSFCFFCCRLANYGHPFASGMDWHHIAECSVNVTYMNWANRGTGVVTACLEYKCQWIAKRNHEMYRKQ